MGRSKFEISGVKDEAGTVFEFAFPSGQSLKYSLIKDHPLYDDFAAQGLNKKVRDVLAGVEGEAAQVEVLKKQLAAFDQGVWNAREVNSGVSQYGLLAKALASIFNVTPAKAQEQVAAMSKKDQATLRADPRVAAEIAALRAAKADGDPTDGLLAGLANAFGVEGEPKEQEEAATEQ